MITPRGSKNVISERLITFWSLGACLCSMTKTLKEAKVDQGIGQCVEVGDGIAIAKVRALNAEIDSLAIDAFGSRALVVNLFVDWALSIERIAQACANAGRHGSCTATFASAFMVNGTRLFNEFVFDILGGERADILTTFVFDDGNSAVGVGEQEWHG